MSLKSFIIKQQIKPDAADFPALYLSRDGVSLLTDTVLADVAKLAGFLSLNPQQKTDMDLNTWITAHEYDI